MDLRLRLASLAFVMSFGLNAQDSTELNSVRNHLIDNYFDSVEFHDLSMGSIALMRDGKFSYRTTYGMANLAPDFPARMRTRYRIGSVSKMFTATLIMLAQEEGKLNLKDKLSQYLDSLDYGEDISIGDLLLQQSGLPNFSNDESYLRIIDQDRSTQDHLDYLQSISAKYPAGTKYEYSSTDYLALGLILEKVYEKPYSKILKRKITGPLKLKNTYLANSVRPSNKEANSYFFTYDWYQATQTSGSLAYSAGGIVSTPTDLCKFIDALFNDKFLENKSLSAMVPPKGQVGLGLFTFDLWDYETVGHSGGIDGFRSYVFYMPEKKLIGAFCSNGSNWKLEDLVSDISALHLGIKEQLPYFDQSIDLDYDTKLSMQGFFTNPLNNKTLSIELIGETIVAQEPLLPMMEMIALDRLVLKHRGTGMRIQFEDDFNSLVLIKNGVRAVYERSY